ncbi:MAG TPA: hypothetical protein VKQ73_18085 [Stellaceae bacterium]|nr:hypothetical protein [Stellaceae bacterium]
MIFQQMWLSVTRRGAILAAFIAFISSMPCSSPMSADAKIAILGRGNDSCGEWTQERQKRSWLGAALEQWVLGFFSAYNAYGQTINGDVTKGTDPYGVMAWIDNYCNAHPLDPIDFAAGHLLVELRARSGH